MYLYLSFSKWSTFERLSKRKLCFALPALALHSYSIYINIENSVGTHRSVIFFLLEFQFMRLWLEFVCVCVCGLRNACKIGNLLCGKQKSGEKVKKVSSYGSFFSRFFPLLLFGFSTHTQGYKFDLSCTHSAHSTIHLVFISSNQLWSAKKTCVYIYSDPLFVVRSTTSLAYNHHHRRHRRHHHLFRILHIFFSLCIFYLGFFCCCCCYCEFCFYDKQLLPFD